MPSWSQAELAAFRDRAWPEPVWTAYLDHALRGPVPRRVIAASAAALDRCAGGRLARAEEEAQLEAARAAVAPLLGRPPHEVAFVANTTAGIATVAQAIRWRPGDRVVVHADEVAANVLPWRALAPRGVEVVVLPSRDGRLEPGDLEAALAAGGVRLVSLAAVALPSGERRDLRLLGELAHRAGALFLVDAAQALGALRVDAPAADFLVAPARKWLLGPPEVGILAIRARLLDELEVPAAGMRSSAADGGWAAGARRFEGGALPAPLLAGLTEAAALQHELGPARIEERVLALAAEVRERGRAQGLLPLLPGGAAASGIVLLRLPAPAPGLERALEERGVVVRVVGELLRVSAHFWNTGADLERLFRALADPALARC